jgi:hypothetical protein
MLANAPKASVAVATDLCLATLTNTIHPLIRRALLAATS